MNVAPVSEIIDVLVLDRGYWGVSFFKELHEKYRIDTVTVGKSNLKEQPFMFSSSYYQLLIRKRLSKVNVGTVPSTVRGSRGSDPKKHLGKEGRRAFTLEELV